MFRIILTAFAALSLCACNVGQAQQSTVSRAEKSESPPPVVPIVPPDVNPLPPSPNPVIPDVGLALTITGPTTAAVNETIILSIQGLPALEPTKTLAENFAWAVPNADGETVLNIEVSAPADATYKVKRAVRIPLPLTIPPTYDAEVQFKPESKGLFVIIAAWTGTTSRIAHHRVLVNGDGPTPPGPVPPGPVPPGPVPEPTTDIAKYIKALAESVVTTGTAAEKAADAAKLAANFENIAQRHKAAGQAVAPPDAIPKVEDGVKKLVQLNQASLGSRVSVWENFSIKFGEYLAKMEQENKIDSTIFGRAKAYEETAAGLRAAWATK